MTTPAKALLQAEVEIGGLQPELAQSVCEGQLPDGTSFDVAVGLQSRSVKVTLGREVQVRLCLAELVNAAAALVPMEAPQ